jgi:hypothetical protein
VNLEEFKNICKVLKVRLAPDEDDNIDYKSPELDIRQFSQVTVMDFSEGSEVVAANEEASAAAAAEAEAGGGNAESVAAAAARASKAHAALNGSYSSHHAADGDTHSCAVRWFPGGPTEFAQSLCRHVYDPSKHGARPRPMWILLSTLGSAVHPGFCCPPWILLPALDSAARPGFCLPHVQCACVVSLICSSMFLALWVRFALRSLVAYGCLRLLKRLRIAW